MLSIRCFVLVLISIGVKVGQNQKNRISNIYHAADRWISLGMAPTWNKTTVVIVTKVGAGTFSLLDSQHLENETVVTRNSRVPTQWSGFLNFSAGYFEL